MADPAFHLPRVALTDGEREASDRLTQLQGSAEVRATLLALLLTPGSRRELRAWQAETRGLSTARAWHAAVVQLSRASRLPWLERMLARMSDAPLGDRQALVDAARRIMSADGQIRPIDRLHWLALRYRLGDAPMAASRTPSVQKEMRDLSLHTLREAGRVTAFLSRLVPTGDPQAGQRWYAAVMAPWLNAHDLPAWQPPDADGLFNALSEVQAMPWMLRPVLVRAWLDHALALSPSHRLEPDAADALRLARLLLDCPMPPELARHYVEPD